MQDHVTKSYDVGTIQYIEWLILISRVQPSLIAVWEGGLSTLSPRLYSTVPVAVQISHAEICILYTCGFGRRMNACTQQCMYFPWTALNACMYFPCMQQCLGCLPQLALTALHTYLPSICTYECVWRRSVVHKGYPLWLPIHTDCTRIHSEWSSSPLWVPPTDALQPHPHLCVCVLVGGASG